MPGCRYLPMNNAIMVQPYCCIRKFWNKWQKCMAEITIFFHHLRMSGFAAVAAFAPVMFGLEYLTVIGFVVGLLLAATFGACFIKEKQ